jgi:tRNA pseudouridine55 synthase
VDKPLAWTSFDVVNKLRYMLSRHLGVKKIKIGHAGTLDPLAIGLLLLCTGDHTKRIEGLQGMDKTYTGTLTFGATTPSFDLEKAIDATFPTAHLNDALLHSLIKAQFMGDIEQLPPVFSAVKVDGRRLYKNARTGEEVELPLRHVHIKAFDIGPLRPVEQRDPETRLINKKGAPIYLHPDYAEGLQADFRIVCGKGTYIRSLAHDLGAAADTGAYLSSLRRTAIGDFSIENAWTMEQLQAILQP